MADDKHDDEDDIVDINDEVDDEEDEIVGEEQEGEEPRIEAASFKRQIWMGMIGNVLKEYLTRVTELPNFSVILAYRRIVNHPVLMDAEFMKIPFDNLTDDEFEDIMDGLGDYEANIVPNLPMTASQRMQQAFKEISYPFTVKELVTKGEFHDEEFLFVNLTEFFWFTMIWEIGGVHHEYSETGVMKIYDGMTLLRLKGERAANHRAKVTADLPPRTIHGKLIPLKERVVAMVPYLLHLVDRAVTNWNYENQHFFDGEKRAHAYIQ